MWIDGVAIQQRTNIGTRCQSDTAGKYLYILGLFDSHDTANDGTNIAFFDDLYVDATWQRIEMCPGSTWANRGKCEAQVPTSWSDTSVAVTVNQGAFSAGATAYLYAVDASGAASSASSVTIGSGGGDTTSPTTTISTTDPSNITSDSLTVTGTASDDVGVNGCKWRIGSAPSASAGTACTGTTSFSCSTSGYSQGANTLYVGCYDAAGNYGADSITVNLDSVLPTVTSRTIPSAGTTFVLGLSEAVNVAGAVPTLSASGGPVTLSNPTPTSNTSTITYTTSRQVLGAETLTASYTQPGNGIEDLAGNDLASFSAQAVTNSSTQTLVALSAPSPSANAQLARATTQTTIGIATDKAATCRWGYRPGIAWGSLTAYGTTGSTSHSSTLSVVSGGAYQICSRCLDTAAAQYSADSCSSFSVASTPKVWW